MDVKVEDNLKQEILTSTEVAAENWSTTLFNVFASPFQNWWNRLLLSIERFKFAVNANVEDLKNIDNVLTKNN